MLNRDRSLLTGEAVEGTIFALGVLVDGPHQLTDRGLPYGVKLDCDTQLGNHAANLAMFPTRALDLERMAGLDQRQQELLLGVEMGQQAVLELAPGRLKLEAARVAGVLRQPPQQLAELSVVLIES